MNLEDIFAFRVHNLGKVMNKCAYREYPDCIDYPFCYLHDPTINR